METALYRLLPFFDSARLSGKSLALATVVQTAGSTYRKSGAQMLIDSDGEYVGLLSGGCLEGDLREHARQVIAEGALRLAQYDMRGPDDELWGLGAGCEGAMDILLQRVGPHEQWQPLAALSTLLKHGERAVLTLVASNPAPAVNGGHRSRCGLWSFAAPPHAPGLLDAAVALSENGALLKQSRALAQRLCASQFNAPIAVPVLEGSLLALPYAPAPSLLLLGAGPDARPVAELAHFLGWRVSVYDHRATLIDPTRFPADCSLHCGDAAQMHAALDPAKFSAVVIMSHQLAADRIYLRALASGTAPYVGLLGPSPRREKLLADLHPDEAAALRPVLRAPVGLDLGGHSPEAIALGIIADIQAQLHGRRLGIVQR
jgi:xanthine/CO dehydrogenase XdhC/CoxF family maturation factor